MNTPKDKQLYVNCYEANLRVTWLCGTGSHLLLIEALAKMIQTLISYTEGEETKKKYVKRFTGKGDMDYYGFIVEVKQPKVVKRRVSKYSFWAKGNGELREDFVEGNQPSDEEI